MTSDTKIIANAVSGKTARPCDCCIKKRARWYCAADDAFLCQGCDGSVHSANPLAWRHERVRLQTASLRRVDHNHNPLNLPSWHWGLTRKTRTPRHAKHFVSGQNPASLMVPELGGGDTTSSSNDCETEDRLLYQVPILDPFEPELSTGLVKEVIKSSHEGSYQPSDLDDLEEFPADVQTLLGKGLDDESYEIEYLGFFECNNDNDGGKMQDFGGLVKEEDEQGNAGEIIKAESDDVAIREPFDLSFDHGENFPTTCELGAGQKVGGREEDEVCKLEDEKKEEVVERKKISLRLDYGAISEAWACQGSPWMNGQRPQINLDDSWPHYLLGTRGGEMRHQLYGEYQIGGVTLGGQGAMGNGHGGREARVSRYREKRRTRLFSKKIRYEVRKLNAQKRPRMKGRFVKRSSFPPTSNSFPLLSK